jgi:hypothetical protein
MTQFLGGRGKVANGWQKIKPSVYAGLEGGFATTCHHLPFFGKGRWWWQISVSPYIRGHILPSRLPGLFASKINNAGGKGFE